MRVDAAKQSLSDAQAFENAAESNAKIAKSFAEDSESEIAFLYEKNIGSCTAPSFAHYTCKSDRTTAMSQLLTLFPDLSNTAIDLALARAMMDKTQACRMLCKRVGWSSLSISAEISFVKINKKAINLIGIFLDTVASVSVHAHPYQVLMPRSRFM